MLETLPTVNGNIKPPIAHICGEVYLHQRLTMVRESLRQLACRAPRLRPLPLPLALLNRDERCTAPPRVQASVSHACSPANHGGNIPPPHKTGRPPTSQENGNTNARVNTRAEQQCARDSAEAAGKRYLFCEERISVSFSIREPKIDLHLHWGCPVFCVWTDPWSGAQT
jgi:hypothetical protein